MTSKILLPILLIALVSSYGCRDKGEAPNTPELTFVSEQLVIDTVAGVAVLYSETTFDFVDGDGNIGTYIENEEGTNDECIDDPDIEVLVYLINAGERTELENARGAFCVADITPVGQNKLLEGEMSVRTPFEPETTVAGDSVLFTVQIQDRDGNKSNVIETPVRVVE